VEEKMPAGKKRPEVLHTETLAALERLHEDEALTSSLDDSSSRLLLEWAEEHIRAIEQRRQAGINHEGLLDDLFLLCRSVNCLNQARQQLSDGQFVQQILGMLDSATLLYSSAGGGKPDCDGNDENPGIHE
jgi:hypothetical protein